VVVSARRAEILEEVARGIASTGGRAMAVPGDVTRPPEMDALVARAVESFGRLDVMICNAGIGFHGSIADSTPEVARRLVETNVLGTMHAARAACGQFARQGSGHVIAVSSMAGVRGVPGMSVYSATKAAQAAFIEALRSEFVGTRLRASVVFPVSAPTELRRQMTRAFGAATPATGPRQSVDAIADAIVRCVVSQPPEVFPYRRGRWLALMTALAPAWSDRFMRRFDRRREARDGRSA